MFKKSKKYILSEIIRNIILNIFNQFFKNSSFSFLSKDNFVNFENISSIYNKNKKTL